MRWLQRINDRMGKNQHELVHFMYNGHNEWINVVTILKFFSCLGLSLRQQ